MSLFKFHDSNYLNGYNDPTIVATVDTYNGNQFKKSSGTAVPFATATEAQAGDIYVMFNIIDKPEITSTDSYKVSAGEYIRGFRLKDYVGQQLDMSADLITDAFSGVVAGDKLVPRTTADTTDTMKWKKLADITGYEVYLEVVKKTTFGAFTTDIGGGTVAGGYLVEVKSTN
jgi:hypothetical protein